MAKKSDTKKKVLIIEDNATTLHIYARKLSGAGYEVIETPTAKDVSRLIETHHPDAIILDLMLQDGDGFDILKTLRSTSPTQKTPIIVLSNLSQQKDIDEATNTGADKYFVKSETNLSEVVEALDSLT